MAASVFVSHAYEIVRTRLRFVGEHLFLWLWRLYRSLRALERPLLRNNGVIEMRLPSITRHCIIEDQDDHIVVAIRIPKAEIANNIHLLAALADIVPTLGKAAAAEIA
jgi:hypothetical protein